MNRFILILLAALAPLSALAQPPALTLADCLDLGITRSIVIANTLRERTLAETDIRRIRGQTLPSIDAAGSFTRLGEAIAYPGVETDRFSRDQTTASLTAEQLLYKGGSVQAALRAAKSYRMRADEETRRITAQVRRDITKAFHELAYNEEAVRVAAASVEQLTRAEEEARNKFERGVLSEFEWLSTQVSLANERPALILAEHRRDTARSILRNLLYLDDDIWTIVPAWSLEPIAQSLTALMETGHTNRWELNQARVFLDVLEADVQVTRGEYFPEIKAFATYAGSDPSDTDFTSEGWDWQWMAGVRATWNLWDGGARGATRIEKGLQKEIAKDAIVDLERAVNLEIETAYRSLRQAQRVLEGADETVRLASKALEIAQVRLANNLGTNLEFTDRNLELNKARLQQLGGLLAYQQALADLTYACGTDTLSTPRSEP